RGSERRDTTNRLVTSQHKAGGGTRPRQRRSRRRCRRPGPRGGASGPRGAGSAASVRRSATLLRPPGRPRRHSQTNLWWSVSGEVRGEPGGSPRTREEGDRAEFSQDRNSLARIPVAEMRGETWIPPQTRAGGERCHETTTLTLRMTTVGFGCPDASPSFPIRSTTFIP